MAGTGDSSDLSGGTPPSDRAADPGADPGTVREEAERFIATALAAASTAARGLGRGTAAVGGLGALGDALFGSSGGSRSSSAGGEPPTGGGPSTGAGPSPSGARPAFANGSPECCVCPVCRVIAALRDPDPQVAVRLAAGAGDLAAGVAGLLRGVVAATGASSRSGFPSRADAPSPDERSPDAPPPDTPPSTVASPGAPPSEVAPSDVAPSDVAFSGADLSGFDGDVWREATRAPYHSAPAAHSSAPEPPGHGHTPMARKAVKRAARPADGTP